MHMAHYSGNKDTIARLLQAGACLKTPNLAGKTPIHCLIESSTLSVEAKQEIILEFLDQYDLTKSDNNGGVTSTLRPVELILIGLFF